MNFCLAVYFKLKFFPKYLNYNNLCIFGSGIRNENDNNLLL